MGRKKLKLVAILFSLALVLVAQNVTTVLAAERKEKAAISEEEIQHVIQEEMAKQRLAALPKPIPRIALNASDDLGASTFSVSFDPKGLGVIKNAYWSQPYNWSIEFDVETEQPLGIYVGLFKNKENLIYYGFSDLLTGHYQISLEDFVDGDGDYSFNIVSVDLNDNWRVEYTDNNPIKYIMPDTPIEKVKNVRFGYDEKISWDKNESASSYKVTEYHLENGDFVKKSSIITTDTYLYMHFDNPNNNFVKITAYPVSTFSYIPSETDYIKVAKSTYNPGKIIESKMSDKTYGVFELTTQNDEEIKLFTGYLFDINNQTLTYGTITFNNHSDSENVLIDVRDAFTESGDYRLYVVGEVYNEASGSYEAVYDYISDEIIHYNKPNKTLETVKNVSWDKYYNLEWDEIKNAEYYTFSVYELDVNGEYFWVSGGYRADANRGHVYSSLPDGKYFVKVVAHPSNICEYSYSSSDYIEIKERDFVNQDNILSDIHWDTEKVGRIDFTIDSDEYLYVYADLYRDGIKIAEKHDLFSNSYYASNYIDFSAYFTETGEYTYSITVKINQYTVAEYNCSNPYIFTAPTKTLDAVKNVKVNKNGLITWDFVPNAESYQLEVYEFVDNEYKQIYGTSSTAMTYYYISSWNNNKQLYAIIRAIPKNSSEYRTSSTDMIKLIPSDNNNGVVKKASWSKTNPGTIECVFNNYEDWYDYCAMVYNLDDENQYYGYMEYLSEGIQLEWNEDRTVAYINVNSRFDKNGNYVFAIAGFKYDNVLGYTRNIFTYCSDEVFSYIKPSEKLAPVTNIRWNNDGIIAWDKNNDVAFYDITIYKNINGSPSNYGYGIEIRGDQNWADISNYLEEFKEIIIDIVCTPKDATKYQKIRTGYILLDSHNFTNELLGDTSLYQLEINVQPYDWHGYVGEKAYFYVGASGRMLNYCWQFSNDGGRNWYNSSADGADTSYLSIDILEKRNGQMYRCVITDGKGNKVISESAKIIVISEAVFEIIEEPKNYSGMVGEQAIFHVEAQGEGLTYQWQFSSDKGYSWHDSGANGSNTDTLVIDILEKRNGQMYRCVITDRNGDVLTSEVAKIIVVVGKEFKINEQPKNCEGQVGTMATFHVAVQGEGLSYQWQFSSDKGYSWHDSGSTGANTDTLSIEILEKRNGQMYRCVITDKSGKQLTTDVSKIIVTKGKEFKITEHPKNYEGKVGTMATFHVGAQGEGLSYQWQFSSDKGYSWHDSGSTGAKTDTLSIEILEKRNGQMYRCVITDKSGKQLTTDVAKIIVAASKKADMEIEYQTLEVETEEVLEN